MKTIFTLVLLSLTLSVAYAVGPVKADAAPLNAMTIMLPVGNNGQMMSLYELAHIKPKEYARVSDRRMNFFDRAAFSIAQKKLRNSINADGTISDKKMTKLVAALDRETGFHIGGFALGFLLGLIGVLIAYLINDEYKSNRRKWAWIGFGSFVLIYLVIILAAA